MGDIEVTRPRNDPRALVDGWVLDSTPVVESGILADGADPIHQQFERDWWGSCANSFGEETKQITYAHRMGLTVVPDQGHWPVYDLGGRSVLDVGGGPASMLLKTINGGRRTVVDPCPYPKWVAGRYEAAGIEYLVEPAEEFEPADLYDEAFLYNVIQHCVDPTAVLQTCRRSASLVRIFEWIDMPPSIGHPHTITADLIRGVLGPGGTIEEVHENGADGLALYGVFPT